MTKNKDEEFKVNPSPFFKPKELIGLTATEAVKGGYYGIRGIAHYEGPAEKQMPFNGSVGYPHEITKLPNFKGDHYSKGKNMLQLVPPEAIEAIGGVLTYGCTEKKPPYKERNWEKGIAFTELLGSIMRHLISFMKREDKDKESTLHPLDHALTDLAMIVAYIRRGREELDDRPFYAEEAEKEWYKRMEESFGLKKKCPSCKCGKKNE